MLGAAPHERRLADGPDSRSPYERDRDRILYTSALRRLAETTQVLPASAGHVYHNRLTHTLEVAQLARRIAECHPTGADPAACEAAAWAHDLGHPPFGHTGEAELDRVLCSIWPEGDGYEGNAQSFRIVTRLAVRRDGVLGLNLTRATLRGILKYPWMRDASTGSKFGAYHTEAAELAWVMEGMPGSEPSIEARIVEFADDVAYSVHDLFDFTRAGLIPMHLLSHRGSEWSEFSATCLDTIGGTELESVFEDWIRPFPLHGAFDGSRANRADLRAYTSSMIHAFVEEGATAEAGSLTVSHATRAAIEVLKQLTVHFVMQHPGLRPVKDRQRAIVARLTEWFADANGRNLRTEAREQLEAGQPLERAVADEVASLTEAEAEELASRI
ncbi:MAG: deoxyguanosinetriphosphate triphosphohydrolase family protein [Fimbriimonadaceae bacterium]